MNELVRQHFLQITNADMLRVCDVDAISPQECVSFPLGELASLGAIFSALPTAFSAVTQVAGKMNVLYEATFPVHGVLASAKDGSGLLGTIINESGVAGQARFHEIKAAAGTASSAGMVFMALAIMAINMSLKNIAENQKSILGFLEIDKQTQLKGDLIILSDIIEDYQYNWNNEQYRNNREMQVLDIKRSAEQNILFYREMIEKKLGKKTFIHIDTSKTLQEIQSKFRYYKLSLYLYAFSSFLDIMLLENFESAYLDSIVEKIERYSSEYAEFYQHSMESIEQYAASSLQSRALQGVAIAGKFMGEQIAKIPDKDNKIKIDDKLISGSSHLEKVNEDAIDKTVNSFSSVEDSGIKMFSDKIRLINRLHNKPIRLLFDANTIYLPNEQLAG